MVLSGRDAPGVYKTGRAISSWAFPDAMKWSEADPRGLISPASKISVSATISMGRVFHTWIGDTDRKSEHVIVDMDSPANDARIAFIDHGNSLGHTFVSSGVPMTACGNYITDVPEDREAMAEAADAIAQISDSAISQVVHRIPVLYLPDSRRTLILANLLARKGNLRQPFGL